MRILVVDMARGNGNGNGVIAFDGRDPLGDVLVLDGLEADDARGALVLDALELDVGVVVALH